MTPGEPAPYPPEHGEVMRRIPFPVGRPEPGREPAPAERASGGTCDLWATLGLGRRGPVAPDDQVRDWRPVA